MSNMYGETCGKEYYAYFGFEPGSGSSYTCYNSEIRLRYAYYDGFFYYKKQVNGKTYLWKSCDKGSDRVILTDVSEVGGYDNIIVNATGIYLFDQFTNTFYIYRLDGTGKKIATAEYEVKSYYICDNRIFIIGYDETNKQYYILWIDAETREVHKIWKAPAKVSKVTNSQGDISTQGVSSVEYIMANNNRVVVWISFEKLYYPEDPEDIIEADGGGWYSFDLRKREIKNINCREIYPHQILKGSKDLCLKWQLGRSSGNWVAIAGFDMKRDLMWIKTGSEKDNTVLWEARKIGTNMPDYTRCSVWKAGTKKIESYGARHYFDGKHRYYASNDGSGFWAYDNDGKESSNWNKSWYRATFDFQICGDRVFLVEDDLGIEHEYELGFEPGSPCCKSWMRSWSDDQEDRRIAENYEKREEHVELSVFDNVEKQKPWGNIAFSKFDYWSEFFEYAFGVNGDKMISDGINASKVADRNWYALRLGNSKVRIELSFNTKKDSIRAGLFFSNAAAYGPVACMKEKISEIFKNVEGSLVWDEKSKSPSISIIRSGQSVQNNRMEQFEWYVKCSCMLARLVKSVI